MSTKFRRRVGAVADLMELEYVSALHQTCTPFLREDGTVSSLDVVRFLKSRIGLIVSPQEGIRIVKGLGGGLVSQDVIQQILGHAENDSLELQKRQEERNIWEKIRLAQSLGALRKKLLLHRGRPTPDSNIAQEAGEDNESLQNEAAVEGVHVDEEMDNVEQEPHHSSEEGNINVTSDQQQGINESNKSTASIDIENPGSNDSQNEECEVYLDLVQIMAILLMPTLARAGQEWHEAQLPPPPTVEEPPPPPPTYEGVKGWVLKLMDSHKAKQQEKEDAFNESLKPKPSNIIPDVLGTLLKSVHHKESEPPVVDATLIRKLLILHGECERAADSVLVDQMVEAATSSSGLLDEEALVKALTSDLSEWKVGAEDANTTSFYDVWGYSNYYEKAILEVEKEEEEEQAAKEAAARGDEENAASTAVQDEGFHSPKTLKLDSNKSTVAIDHDKELTLDSFTSAVAHDQDSEEVYFDSFRSAVVDTQDAAADSFRNAVVDTKDAAINLGKGVETEGVNIVKQAGTDGAKIVKGAQKGGAKQVEAEKIALAENPAVKFTGKIFQGAGEHLNVPEKNKEHPTSPLDENRVEMELEAHRDDSPDKLHHRSSKNTEAGDKTDYKPTRTRSMAAIDSATDTYSSSLLMVGIFVFFICTSLVYASLFLQMSVFDPQCGDNFSCLLVDKIITWAIFAVFLALTGYFVIIPLSTGNNPEERSPFVNIVAIFIALVLTWIPYAAVETYKKRTVSHPYDQTEQTVERPEYAGSELVTRVIGCIVAGLIAVQFILALIGNRRIRQKKWASRFLLTSTDKGGGRSKRAATRKINRLLENACNMKPKNETPMEKSGLDVNEELMINFVIRGESFEDCGGLLWTWKQLASRDLFEEEGVWIMSRLLVIQTIQALFIGFKTYALTLLIEEAIRRCEQWQDDLRPGYPQWVYDFVPSPREARIALWPAFSSAVLVMFAIFFVYLPSYVRRVIEYRCGMIPSLHTTHFAVYRKSTDLVYTNIGNALYAMFGAALLFFFLVGLVIFLFIWPATKNFMILLLAWGLGLCITICIKYVIQVFWRARFYAGFYRKCPKKANLTQLAFECWYIGLGGGVLVSRFCQFILAACFFVGRTDVPFLSANVSMFGYIFDYAPQSFVKDILVHEAHRHPYLERLFAMYMMKLKNDSFCSEAGACWRQLFVATLMPWMLRLRVFSDERLGDKMDEYNARRREGQSPLQIRQQAEIKQNVMSERTSQDGKEAGESAQKDSSAPPIGDESPKN